MEAKKIVSALQAERKSSLDDLSVLYGGHRFQDGVLTIILNITEAYNAEKLKDIERRVQIALQTLPELSSGNAVRVVITGAQALNLEKEEAAQKQVKTKMKPEGVGKIILVASGKGGVGKSTVAANLSIALMDLGYKVGLLDADIYGPSVPKLFGVLKQPIIKESYMQPISSCKISLMSMGFLVAPEVAAIWRGPMVSKAMHQMLMQTKWGELDYLIVDTPPGTGDVHLSLAENYQVDAAIVVTTPQELAVIDANKAVDMFGKLNVQVLGIVENMSYLIEPSTGNRMYIFGQDGGLRLAKRHNIPLLAQIPVSPEVVGASDAGKPITYYEHDAVITHIFGDLARAIAE